MPYKDGSGPNGEGSLSGRGAGNCTKGSGTGALGRRRMNRGRRLGRVFQNEDFGSREDLSSLKSALKIISENLEKLKKG